MKKIIGKVTRALQVILMAPIKLPGKALNIIRYIALGLGVVESVLDKGKDPPADNPENEDLSSQDIVKLEKGKELLEYRKERKDESQ